jgi:hypothetical protein
MKKILATGATENYYNTIVPYLKTIELNSNFDDNVLVTLDFKKETFNKVKNSFISNFVVKNKNENNCLQHGEFLKSEYFNSLNDEDIICFTDGDISLQRPLDEEEIKFIESLKDGDIMVQYNAGPKDTLKQEFYRLGPNINHTVVEQDYQINLENILCYNTGVIICNLKTWNILQEKYDEYFTELNHIFSHYAKQQWIISFVIHEFLNPIVMDYSMHTHYHHGRLQDTIFKDDIQYYKEKIVLFSHFSMDHNLPFNKNGFSQQQSRFLRKFGV